MNLWKTLSPDSRVWLYGANRILTGDEQREIAKMLDVFCDSWAAHGAKLECGYSILFNQLIVLAVDERSAAASGCSIDSSVQVFKDIDATYQLDLFNRLRSYLVDDNHLVTLSNVEIKNRILANELSAESVFIDTLVSTKHAVDNQLTKRLIDTWLNKYLPLESR